MKGFIWGLDLLKKGLRKILGNGASIQLFRDSWLPRPLSFKVISPYPIEDTALVDEFISPSIQWDVLKLRQHLCEDDVEMIINFPISKSAPDRWIWHYAKNGKYSVRSGYKAHMMGKLKATPSNLEQVSKWWNMLWKLNIPNKSKPFVWRSFHNSIPTHVNLGLHHVEVEAMCHVCRKHPKTTDHALFRYSRSKRLWRHLIQQSHIGGVFYRNVQDRWLWLGMTQCIVSVELICVGAWAV